MSALPTDEMYDPSTIHTNNIKARTCKAHFETFHPTALLYAVECLRDETPDFRIGTTNYKIDDRYTQYVNSSATSFSPKEIAGCEPGTLIYSMERRGTKQISDSQVASLIEQRKNLFGDRSKTSDFEHIYVFAYKRYTISIEFDFHYGSDGTHPDYVQEYDNLKFRQKIDEYQYAKPNFEKHEYLSRPNWHFTHWTDQYGAVYTEEEWKNMVVLAAKNSSSDESKMIFHAEWEPLEGSVIQFFENEYVTTPIEEETKVFFDGQYVAPPTSVHPENGWMWVNSDTNEKTAYTGTIPMYGEYGVPGKYDLGHDGTLDDVYIVNVYGSWNFSDTRVYYKPGTAGVPESVPVDKNIYTAGESIVPVGQEPEKQTGQEFESLIFAGWKLNKNNEVYQPGDHVAAAWDNMTFTAQWVEEPDAVKLKYCSNSEYQQYYPGPTEAEFFAYKDGSKANVWDNAKDNVELFKRENYVFTNWNTEPDGSGDSYEANGIIDLTGKKGQTVVLYAQWKADVKTLNIQKSIEGAVTVNNSFRFKIELENEGRFPIPDADAGYSLEKDNKTIIIALKNGEAMSIKVPANAELMITELNPEGYKVKFTDDNGFVAYGSAQKISMDKIDKNIIVHNISGVILPSTGGIGVIPFYALGGAMIAGAAVCAAKKKRRKEGDSPP